MARTTKSEKKDTYQRVTDAIVARLDEGVVPWRKPWASFVPMSARSGKPYRGLNHLLLTMEQMDRGFDSHFWGTYKRLAEFGAQVRKGERSSMVTFWTFLERKDDPEKKRVPFLRAYNVFNVEQAEWPDGMPAKWQGVGARPDVDPIASADAAIADYLATGPKLTNGGSRACYSPDLDRVSMPARKSFADAEGYYATLFHELTHSTGHKSRLDRSLEDIGAFGDPVYSREELVAELGAQMVAATVGIETPALLDNAAAYIAGWRAKLIDDPKALAWAAGRAQKAADLILSVQADEEGAAA